MDVREQVAGPVSPKPLPPPKGRANAFFRSWARVVQRYRVLVLVGTALLSAGMLHLSVTQLRVDNSTEAFLDSDDDSTVVLEELRDAFGQDVVYQVLATGDVFSLPYLERLRALHAELEALDMELDSLGQRTRVGGGSEVASDQETIEGVGFADFAGGDDGWGEEAGGSIVDEVISLVNVRRTRGTADGVRVTGLLDDWPTTAELPRLKQTALSDRTLVGQVIGEDGRHSVLVVRTQFMNEEDSGRVYLKLREIAEQHEAPGFELEVAGAPALFVSLNARMLEDMGLTFGVSNVLMLLAMFLIFRHPIGVIGPLLVCVLAALFTVGLMAIAGRPMTMITNVLPAFLLCVGVGDSIHVQSVYRDARRAGHANADAIVYALGSTGLPVLFTSLTTAIGLLSFRFAHLQAIRDMGTFGAVGVMIALLNSLIMLPAVLSFNRRSLLGARPERTGRDLLDRFLRACNAASMPADRMRGGRSYRVPSLLLGACLAAACVATATTMGVYHNPLKWFPAEDETRQAVEHLDDEVGGMATVLLLVEASPGVSLRSRDALVALEKLEQHILAYRDPEHPHGVVTNATSVLDVVRESWRATHQGSSTYYRLPDSQQGVSDMLTLFENADPDELERMVTVDFSKTLVTIRAHWLDAWSYRPLAEHIREGVRKYMPEDVSVRPTGTVFSTVSVVSTLLADLLRSFGTAFIVITLIMVVLLRSLRLGVIAMVPNMLPILATMGFMVAVGIPVDTTTLMVASIAIGIAVDDTIHFIHQFAVQMKARGDVEEALDYSFSHSGRAMISTSVILVAGFMSLNVGYMGNMKAFGSLISVAVVFALLSDLVLTPALLRTFYPRRAEVSDVAPGERGPVPEPSGR